MPLSRAAAASSAVPVVLSPVTINNYGGTCNRTQPAWVKLFIESDNPPRPAARAIRSLKADEAYGDSVHRPYLHLVDGGVSDNVGMRGVLDSLEVLEALHECGHADTARQRARGSSSSSSIRSPRRRRTGTSRSPRPAPWTSCSNRPARRSIAYSYEAVELLKDTAAQWQSRAADPQFGRNGRQQGSRASQTRCVSPNAEIYAIDVSFAALQGQGGVRVPESAADKSSCCRPRQSIACALPRERSFSHRPSSSAC